MGEILFLKVKLKVEIKLKVKIYFIFRYNCKIIFYYNKKLLICLDIITIKVSFKYKIII